MPAPPTNRVPDAYAREVLRTLKRHGWLDVVVGMLWDRHDFKQASLVGKFEREVVTGDAKQLGEIQKAQGALAELAFLTSWLTDLARAEPEPKPGTDGLTHRPARQPSDVRRKRQQTRL